MSKEDLAFLVQFGLAVCHRARGDRHCARRHCSLNGRRAAEEIHTMYRFFESGGTEEIPNFPPNEEEAD
jgi:hypothetical protein